MSQYSLAGRLTRVRQGIDGGADIFELATSGAGPKFAAGTGTLVSGTVVIATGLTTVTAFSCLLNSTGNTAAGATESESVKVTSITTGAVTVGNLFHSATASVSVSGASGTASFYWIALGT